MTARFAHDQTGQCDCERYEVVDDAVNHERAEQRWCGDLRQAGDDRGLEYAEPAGDIAEAARSDREHIQADERLETDAMARGQQHVEHTGGDRKIGTADRHLQDGRREARQGQQSRPELEWSAACRRQHKVPRHDCKERDSDRCPERRLHVQDGGGTAGLDQQ
jgi:hypothetical protein